jgi:hypothetical protein
LSFLRRSDEDKSIAAMRFVEGADDDGFRFQDEW